MTSGKHLSIRTTFIRFLQLSPFLPGALYQLHSFSREFGRRPGCCGPMNREMNEVASWSIGKFLAAPAGLNRTISILLE
jgi:hypothetical protein